MTTPTSATEGERLLSAARTGDLPTLKDALSRGAYVDSVDEKDQTALYIVARDGDAACVNVLLDAGARINRRTKRFLGATAGTALNNACAEGRCDVVALLLERGADSRITSHSHSTPAHIVIQGMSRESWTWSTPGMRAREEAVRLLLEAGNPVNQPDMQGHTLLTLAMSKGATPLSLINLLLDHGADPNFQDRTGHCALHHRCDETMHDVIRLLAERKADLNGRDSVGLSPLLYATEGRTIQLLVDLGADVNHIDDLGRTPLQVMLNDEVDTITADQEQKLATLINCGANIDLRDYSGESVADILRAIGDEPARRLSALAASQRAKTAMRSVRGSIRLSTP
jgi:ankyrin repeat protein